MLWRGILLTFVLLMTPAAQADVHTWEFGGGLARAKGASSFFNQQSEQELGLSPFLSLGIAPNIYHGPVRVYLGLQHRIHLYSDTTSGYGWMSLYPYLELGIWRFFFGAGYTPFVWKNVAPGGSAVGFDYARAGGTTGLFFQGGFIMGITPEVSLNLVASYEKASGPAGDSPSSAMTFGAAFRFYFGGEALFSGGSGGGRGKYRGYRYPLGFERN